MGNTLGLLLIVYIYARLRVRNLLYYENKYILGGFIMTKETMDKLTCCVIAIDILVLIVMNVFAFNPVVFNVLRVILAAGMITGFVMLRKTQKMFYQERES